jgi:hypothetical protein
MDERSGTVRARGLDGGIDAGSIGSTLYIPTTNDLSPMTC